MLFVLYLNVISNVELLLLHPVYLKVLVEGVHAKIRSVFEFLAIFRVLFV